MLTEYLTLFWFAFVNEYKLEYVSIQKSSKDAKFGQCLYLWAEPQLTWSWAFELFGILWSNFPLPGQKCCSNAPHITEN